MAHGDAVEIDPVILALGEAARQRSPYADPRVTTYVDDARSFLRRTGRRYDAIVLGTLDSQTLLSGFSSLRLDNYVYTVEAFQAMRAHLKPGGHLVAYHMSPTVEIAAKIFHLVKTAFGKEPVVLFQPQARLFNYTFVVGPEAVPAPDANAAVPDETPPHDDWPYLYLFRRVVPSHYVWALAAILVLAAGMVGWAGGRELTRGFDGLMFALGAGFLLVETKSVTEMSLLFGSTWTVNLLVFFSVLLMILLANLVIGRRPGRSCWGCGSRRSMCFMARLSSRWRRCCLSRRCARRTCSVS